MITAGSINIFNFLRIHVGLLYGLYLSKYHYRTAYQ